MIDNLSTIIKPCPFCGHSASLGRINDPDHIDFGGEWISCDNPRCGISTELRFTCMEDVKPLLVETWNRRVAV